MLKGSDRRVGKVSPNADGVLWILFQNVVQVLDLNGGI